VALCLGSAFVLAVLAVLYLPRTEWGREKVRVAVENALNGQFAGKVHVGSIDLPVFTRATVHDVVITDSAGAPFIVAPLVQGTWSLGDLWNKRVILDNVRAERPVIVLNRLPGKRWNWDAILFPDTTKRAHGPDAKFGDWVELRNVTLIDAKLTARSPYAPEAWRAKKGQDSVLALALAGKLRAVVEAVPSGNQRVTVLEHVSLFSPHARIKYPGQSVQLFEIARGSGIIKPFHPPVLDLRGVSGTVYVNSDSVWFRNVAAVLPQSKATLNGEYNLVTGDASLTATAPSVVTDDWLWLVPLLPKGGTGSIGDVKYVLRGSSSDVRLHSLSLALEQARLNGTLDFGFDKDDTRFDDVKVRLDALDTRLVKKLLPDVKIPRDGVLSGTLAARGPLTGATIDGTFRFDDTRAGPLNVRMRGIAGSVGTAVLTQNLRMDIAPLPVTLASVALEPLGGKVGGVVTVNGRTDGWLDTKLALVHSVNGLDSHINGTARVNITGVEPTVDANLTFAPLSLRAMGRFAPALDLRGNATGTLTLRGVLSDMAITSSIRVDSAGGLLVTGRYGVPTRGASFADVLLTADSLDLRRLVPTALATKLVGVAQVNARGTSAEDLEGTVVLDLRASEIDRVRVDTVTMSAKAHAGLLTLDTLMLRVGGAVGSGSGTFGLRKGVTGELQLAVAIDSLQRLRPYMKGDSTLIAPTQAAIARSLRRQRADSLALARRTEVERAARGLAPIALRITPPAPVRGDSLAGSAELRVTLRGWLRDISGTGTLDGKNLFLNGNSVQRVAFRPIWANILTDTSSAQINGTADGMSVAGFNVDSLDVAAGYNWQHNTLANGTGTLGLDVHLIDSTGVALKGALVLDSATYLARVDSTSLILPSSKWANPYPWRASWSRGRLTIDSLALQTEGDARLQVDAAVDTAGATNVTLAIRNTQLWDLADLAQTLSPIDGRVSADLYVDGVAANPKISFLGAIRDVVYDSLPLPEFRARMNYADRKAVAHAEVRRPGQAANALADATIPVNLALSGNPKRLIDQPMIADIKLDSLPLDIIPALSAAVSGVKGETRGRIQVRGTLPDKLTFDGDLTLRKGEAFIVATEVHVTDMAGDIHFRGDSMVVDSVLAHSGEGTIRLTGGVALKDITNPVFDLKLVARNARVIDGSHGRIRGLADLTLTGPYKAAAIEGSLRVRSGVYRLAESKKVTEVLNANDPAVLGAVDSTEAIQRGLVVPPSDFLRGLKTSVVARIDRDVWVRSSEANVEIFTDGELQVAVNPVTGGVTLDGIVATERGQYEFLQKRFNIVRGSATFLGTSDLNPLLQAVADYQIKQSSQQALAIHLNIGGTLLRPRLSLESDAQPPIPQTDLISYLAFGSSSGSLLSSVGSGGATSTGALFGNALALANRQLAAVGLGTLLNSVEGGLARYLGADVLNITSTGVAPEVQNIFSGFGGFLLATELEYGRYFGTKSYVVLTLSPARFATPGQISPVGLRWEYRLPRSFRLETTFGPRFLLQSQSLDVQDANAFNNFGLFLSREWKW
jgi:translocation and assembly module TamB